MMHKDICRGHLKYGVIVVGECTISAHLKWFMYYDILADTHVYNPWIESKTIAPGLTK